MGTHGSITPRLLAIWHRFAGRVRFHTGRLCCARRHFERVLTLVGDDYVSHVFLGRIAYASGDYQAWHRRFELARQTSPQRFAHLRGALEMPNPRGGDNTETPHPALPRPGWGDIGPTSEDGRLSWTPRPHRAGWPDEEWGFEAPPGDDFCSEAEREKFQNLGPIRSEDIYAVDLDELLRRLGS